MIPPLPTHGWLPDTITHLYSCIHHIFNLIYPTFIHLHFHDMHAINKCASSNGFIYYENSPIDLTKLFTVRLTSARPTHAYFIYSKLICPSHFHEFIIIIEYAGSNGSHREGIKWRNQFCCRPPNQRSFDLWILHSTHSFHSYVFGIHIHLYLCMTLSPTLIHLSKRTT